MDFDHSYLRPTGFATAPYDISSSHNRPQPTTTLSFYHEKFFLNRYFVDYMSRQVFSGDPLEKQEAIFAKLTENHPWIAWNHKNNILEIHFSGAKEMLLDIVGRTKPLWRGGSLLEFQFLEALQLLAYGKPTLSDQQNAANVLGKIYSTWRVPEELKPMLQDYINKLNQNTLLDPQVRRQIGSALIVIVSYQSNGGAVASTFFKGKAAYWAFSMGEAVYEKKATGVLEFDLNFNRLPIEAYDGLYVGVESDYVEVLFKSVAARLEMLKSLSPNTLSKNEVETEFGPNFEKIWNWDPHVY